MVKLTMIARVTDGLPLAEGLDDSCDVPDADLYKQHAKSLFKNLSMGQIEASRMSIETGPYIFHYIIEGHVCYLTMCDRSYPKKLAFQYLEDLKMSLSVSIGVKLKLLLDLMPLSWLPTSLPLGAALPRTLRERRMLHAPDYQSWIYSQRGNCRSWRSL